jgi:alkylhydroperoxidase/carboxymuconolactone decarboxylase family protein YurZ
MASTQTELPPAEESLKGLAAGDAPVLETLAQMTVGTMERSGLDEKTYFLVRLAALIAIDAAPVSYLLNVGAAADSGVDLETARGLVVAIAPIVGTARVASAVSKLIRAGILGEALRESVDEDDGE